MNVIKIAGIIKIMPGITKINATNQCHPQKCIAPKNAPNMMGSVKRSTIAKIIDTHPQTAPKEYSIPAQPIESNAMVYVIYIIISKPNLMPSNIIEMGCFASIFL